MNTANLQLEGVYLAIAATLSLLREKGLVSEEEIDTALAGAEVKATFDPDRPAELSAAHVDAICFPLRLLRLANHAHAQGRQPAFTELATRVGETKPGH
jgi:hypothetical protein